MPSNYEDVPLGRSTIRTLKKPVSTTKLAQNRLGDVVLIGLPRKRSERAGPCGNILYRQRSVRALSDFRLSVPGSGGA